MVELLAGGDQGIGGRLPIEAQGGVARGNQGSIDGTHERIDTRAANLKVLIKGAEGFGKCGGIEVSAVFALEGDGTAEKR